MIWTYAKASEVVQEHLNQILKETIRNSQLQFLSQIPHQDYFEGSGHNILREDGSRDGDGFSRVEASGTLALRHDRPLELQEAEAEFKEMGKRFAIDLSSKVMKTIDAQLTKAGRVSKGPVSPEKLLALLGDMYIDFDSEGRPVWPSLHAGKDAYPKIRAAWTEMVSTEKHRNSLIKIINRKRNEWLDRENRKYLAD